METPIFEDEYEETVALAEHAAYVDELTTASLFDDCVEESEVIEHVPCHNFTPQVDDLPVGVQDLLGRLSRCIELTFGGRAIKRNKHTRYTPLDLPELAKLELNGGNINIQLSAFGIIDTDLSNVSITGETPRILSGSGANVIHEYWQKMDGTDMYFFSLSGRHFVMFFLDMAKRWAVEECSHFIPEGAELVDRTIYLRSLPFSGFRVFGSSYKAEFVRRSKIGNKIECVEGIILMVNGKLERLKKRHTIDLVNYKGFACTASGKQYFMAQGDEGQIGEYTLGGSYLRPRPDKTRPDTDKKYDRLKKAHTVDDLNSLLSQYFFEPSMYIPQIYPGFDIVSKNLKANQTPSILVQGRLGWIYTPDKNDLCRNFTDYSYGLLSDFIDSDYYFSFTKYCKFLERSGMSFYYGDVREFLFKSGVYQYYEHWRATKTYKDGVLTPDRLSYSLFYDPELRLPTHPLDRRMYDLPPSYLRDNYDSFLGEVGYYSYGTIYKTIDSIDDIDRKDNAIQQLVDLLHKGPMKIDELWTCSNLSFKAFHDTLSYMVYESMIKYDISLKTCTLDITPVKGRFGCISRVMSLSEYIVNNGQVYLLDEQFTPHEREHFETLKRMYLKNNAIVHKKCDNITEIREAIVCGLELDYIVYDVIEMLMERERGVKIQFEPKGEWIHVARQCLQVADRTPFYTRGYVTKFVVGSVTYYASELLGLLWCDIPGSLIFEINVKEPDLAVHVAIACNALRSYSPMRVFK